MYQYTSLPSLHTTNLASQVDSLKHCGERSQTPEARYSMKLSMKAPEIDTKDLIKSLLRNVYRSKFFVQRDNVGGPIGGCERTNAAPQRNLWIL